MKKSMILVGMLAIGYANAQEGKVGINTETPSATLNVKTKDDAQSPKNLELENQAGTKLVTVFNNGNVGIGTTNIAPVSILFVRGEIGSITKDDWATFSAVGDKHIQFAGTHYRGDVEHFIEQWATKGIKDQSRMEYSKEGDKFVSFLGYDYKGVYDNPALNVYDGSGGMHIYADGDHSFDSKPSRIDFITTPANGIHSQTRMTINNAGNVGIGTTNPTEKLEVAGSIKSSALAGTGVRNVVADASGKLIIGESADTTLKATDTTDQCTADKAGTIHYKEVAISGATNGEKKGVFGFCTKQDGNAVWVYLSNGGNIMQGTGTFGQGL